MTTYGAAATRERKGWFFGFTGAQLAIVILAAIPAWMAMALGQWATLVLLIPVWVLVVTLTTIPVRGWSAAQWIGVAVRHGWGSVSGWTRWQSKAAAGEIEDPGEADLPGVLSGIAIHDGPPMGATMTRVALIQNNSTRTWAATARIEHPGLGLASDDERLRMGAGLAELCESATQGDLISLFSICVRTVPDDGAERADWVRRNTRADAPELAVKINRVLDRDLMPAAVRREAFVTVVVSEDKISKDARRCGGGIKGRARLLYGLLGEVESRLRGAIECSDVTWLDTAELAAAIRTGFEPGDAAALAGAEIAHRSNDAIKTGIPVAAAGPTNAATALRSYRHGEWDSIATTILIPDQGALLGALAPVLVPTQAGERRSLTVFFRPVSRRTANKVTGRDEVSAAMGKEMRRKAGMVDRAAQRRAEAHVRDNDEKLARGRSLVRVSSALAVTVPAGWGAQDYGRRLDASVRLCGFTPLPLDGAHDAAFAAAAIPLGTGLPKSQSRK